MSPKIIFMEITKYEVFCRESISKEAGDDDGDGGDDDGRIFPEHPSPILHAPRDNISRKGNPSLRYRIVSKKMSCNFAKVL